jgi:hypothetical protein|tara:strand:+ start:5 stop:448 length:444 start_codon:yes stop_codon:yes gene_type:complete
MAFFDRVHFEGIIKISEIDIDAKLTSQIYRGWDNEDNIPWESWHYHLTMSNHRLEVDRDKGIDTGYTVSNKYKGRPEYHVPYISETGFRSDFFMYEKKPSDLKMDDVKHVIEGRVKVLLGKNLEFMKAKPVEVVSKIPEESWEDTDE